MDYRHMSFYLPNKALNIFFYEKEKKYIKKCKGKVEM